MTNEISVKKFDVGGLLYDRPFKIRRLNHFGISVDNTGEAVAFYRDVLGFQVSDVLDTAKHDPGPWLDGVPDTNIYFTRHNNDHHTFVIMPRPWAEHAEQPPRSDITINQLTWQVGSLREVVEARKWLDSLGQKIDRYGRDPGSNWHTYFPDPTGHCNELEYGIEQIGWDGLSKPDVMWPWVQGHPELPYKSEATEVADAIAEGVDPGSGYRWIDESEKSYDVGGVLMGRPFKIVRVGPASLFVEDLDSSIDFYTNRLGLTLTEESVVLGHRVAFLRANTEHHSLTLLPIELRKSLGVRDDSTLLSFGVQVGSYEQLCAAKDFLVRKGIKILDLPQEVTTGIDYVLHAVAPDGSIIQLYYYMEQIGWDQKPRSPEQRRKVEVGVWPETLDPSTDSYHGETFWGPLG